MKFWKATAATIALTAIGSVGAMAQDTSTNPNAMDAPSATAPTTTAPASEGASPGTSGVDTPAGIPADPNTTQNVQPGMSTNTPNDPAAGSNPGARAPTSPAGTGSSSPSP